jgi:hypothetical protein
MLLGAAILPGRSDATTTRTTRLGGWAGKPLHGTEQCFDETFGSIRYPQGACTGGQAVWYMPQNNADDNGGLWGSSAAVNIVDGSTFLTGAPTCSLLSIDSNGSEFNTSGDIPSPGRGNQIIWLPQQNSAAYEFQFIRCVLFPQDQINEVTVSSITPR